MSAQQSPVALHVSSHQQSTPWLSLLEAPQWPKQPTAAGAQSPGQPAVVSPVWHLPSPQIGLGQAPQSPLQLVQVSLPLHLPSPHWAGGQAPQSLLQLLQLSLPQHNPSPHLGLGQGPSLHLAHLARQALSKVLLQQ